MLYRAKHIKRDKISWLDLLVPQKSALTATISRLQGKRQMFVLAVQAKIAE